MARPAKFTRDELLDAAAEAAASHWRDATIAHVAARIGAPVGSIYHRFGSRQELFAALWLRSVRRFHEGLLAAFARPDAQEAALAVAVHIPGFCRAHPLDAAAMTLYRQADLAERGPDALRQECARVNDAVEAESLRLVERRFGRVDEFRIGLVRTACREGPYGLVRRYLRGPETIPAWLDDAVRASAAAILALGD